MAALRVLLIEDNAGAREGLGRLLADEGYDVRTASSGETGLHSLVGFNADVVVCDFDLPGMNGLKVLRLVRAWRRDVLFVMLTSGTCDCDADRALRAEADVYLTKPVDLRRLRALLADAGATLPPAMGATF